VFRYVVSFAVLSPGFNTVRRNFDSAIKEYNVGMSLPYIQWKLSTTLHGAYMAGVAKKRSITVRPGDRIDTVQDCFYILQLG
jgi:hypothetical protein